MSYLNFSLPDFCRLNWVSEAARSAWEPTIRDIVVMWRRLETDTIIAGMRSAAIVIMHRNGLEFLRGMLSENRLAMATLYTCDAKGLYISDINKSNAGGELFACAVADPTLIDRVTAAYKAGDAYELGGLLGYPECCISFFDQVWNRDHVIDTTWATAIGLHAAKVDSRLIEASIAPENNLLLRWIGVRPVFHLPCSNVCEHTHSVATTIRDVAIDSGYKLTLDRLYEMLSWPVNWSALHGIAEVETPVFRISARTDATAEKYVLRKGGTAASIVGAADGKRFPFLQKRGNRREPASKVAAPKAMSASVPPKDQRWYYMENGFAQLTHMQGAFAPIVAAVVALTPRFVVHLGCRNGALLDAVAGAAAPCRVFGIDPDPCRIGHAKSLMPTSTAEFVEGSFWDDACMQKIPQSDVCVLMLGRLLESPDIEPEKALQTLLQRTKTLMVYAFDDWLRQLTAQDMAQRLGLTLEVVSDAPVLVAKATLARRIAG